MPSKIDAKYDPEGKGKPEEGLLLAEISKSLQELDAETPKREAIEELVEQLDLLARLAAGNMHVEIGDRSKPKAELAEPWTLAFEKLYEKAPIPAAQAANKAAIQTGFGSAIGKVTRSAAAKSAETWAILDYDSASKATYDLALQCPFSNWMEGNEEKTLLNQAMIAYAALHDPSNERQANVTTARNLLELINRQLQHNLGTEEETKALTAGIEKFAAIVDTISEKQPKQADSLVHKLVSITDQRLKQAELKPIIADAVMKNTIVDTMDEFNQTREIVRTWSNNDADMNAAFLTKVFENDTALIKNEPVAYASRIAELVTPYGDTNPEFTAKAEKSFVACMDAIKSDDDLKVLAGNVQKYDDIYDKVIGRLRERAERKTFSTNPETLAASIDDLLYVAHRLPAFGHDDNAVMELALKTIDKLERADRNLAIDKAFSYYESAQTLGKRQAPLMEKLYNIQRVLGSTQFKESAEVAGKFVRKGLAKDLSARDRALLKALTHNELGKAVTKLKNDTVLGDDEFYPYSRKGFNKLEDIINKISDPAQQASKWLDVHNRLNNYPYHAKDIAAKNFLTALKSTEEQLGKTAAVDAIFDLFDKCDKTNNEHANLVTEAIKILRKYTEDALYVDDDRELADHVIDKLYNETGLMDTQFHSFKWAMHIDRDLGKAEQVDKLAEQLDVSAQAVYGAGKSKLALRSAYNKHAFWDWSKRQMDKQSIRGAFFIAASAGLVTTSLMTYASSYASDIKTGIVMGCIFAGYGLMHAASYLSNYKSAQKGALAKELEKNHLKSIGQLPPEPERLSVKDFMNRHAQAEEQAQPAPEQDNEAIDVSVPSAATAQQTLSM